MANLPRSAKSGKDWTPNDLDSYNISLNHQLDPLQFFDLQVGPRGFDVLHSPPNNFPRQQKFPQPSVGQELLNIEDGVTMREDRHAQLISLLDLTMFPDEGENIVIDFTVKLLEVLGYTYRDRVTRTRVNLEFLVCGEGRYAETDVCIFDQTRRETLLLVQTHKRRQFVSLDQKKDQLVAGDCGLFPGQQEKGETWSPSYKTHGKISHRAPV